ncbi:MAG: hypothetical protein U0793_18145 [Gemmataceae bacterium]
MMPLTSPTSRFILPASSGKDAQADDLLGEPAALSMVSAWVDEQDEEFGADGADGPVPDHATRRASRVEQRPASVILPLFPGSAPRLQFASKLRTHHERAEAATTRIIRRRLSSVIMDNSDTIQPCCLAELVGELFFAEEKARTGVAAVEKGCGV